MFIPQIISMVGFLGVVGFVVMRSMRPKSVVVDGGAGQSVQGALDALAAGFAQTREPDETEPVCVIAHHHTMMSTVQVAVGVTNRRVLVVMGAMPMTSFRYDDEAEHLPSSKKKKDPRAFFEWSHGPFGDGSTGYSPTVKQAPFKGEEWRMYPVQPGFAAQTANLCEFSQRFYFQWFYD